MRNLSSVCNFSLVLALIARPAAFAFVSKSVPPLSTPLAICQDRNEIVAATRTMAEMRNAQNGVLDAELRQTLSDEFFMQVQNPDRVAQGQHNTCAVACLESRLYRRAPSVVARVLCDAALSATVVDAAGRRVNLPPTCLVPDADSLRCRRDPNARTFASQVFQLSACNLYWRAQTRTPAGIKVKPLAIAYVQSGERFDRTDTGERLIVESEGSIKETLVDASGAPACHPHFTFARLKVLNEMLTGERQTPWMISVGRKVSGIASALKEEDLHRLLCQLKVQQQLPALISRRSRSAGQIITVDGCTECYEQHVVGVTDYDESTKTARIHDTAQPAALKSAEQSTMNLRRLLSPETKLAGKMLRLF